MIGREVKIDRRTLMLSFLRGGTGLSALLASLLLFWKTRIVRLGRENKKPESRESQILRITQESDVVVFSSRGQLVVALRFDKEVMDAPMITAKAEGADGNKMLSAAILSDTAIYQDDRLAMTMLRRLRIGEPIPRKAYKPVASVLARVYRAREKGRAPLVHIQS